MDVPPLLNFGAKESYNNNNNNNNIFPIQYKITNTADKVILQVTWYPYRDNYN